MNATSVARASGADTMWVGLCTNHPLADEYLKATAAIQGNPYGRLCPLHDAAALRTWRGGPTGGAAAPSRGERALSSAVKRMKCGCLSAVRNATHRRRASAESDDLRASRPIPTMGGMTVSLGGDGLAGAFGAAGIHSPQAASRLPGRVS